MLGRDRRHRTGQRPQHRVRLGVADQDPAEQGAVRADHQFAVDPGTGVGVDDVEAALGGAVRVAEARHVHAEQLQLRGQVGAGEGGTAGGARDDLGGGLGHLVAGRDQSVDPAVGGLGALADREDRRVGRTAGGVHHDPAALADRQPAGPGQFVTRPHPGGEDHQVGGERRTVRQRHRGHPAAGAGHDLPGADARTHPDAQALDTAPERLAAALVHLRRHQPRRELHHVRVQAEPLERARRLQAEQPAADHRAGPGSGGVRLDGEQVLDRAVDEAARRVPARHRGYERVRAGGQHQRVVAEGQARTGGHRTGVTVHGHRGVADAQLRYRAAP